MICAASIYLILRGGDPSIAAETLLQGLFNPSALLVIRLFILAADIMNVGSLADRLLHFSPLWRCIGPCRLGSSIRRCWPRPGRP
uniref:hypothetical protein n=1 Tax=Chachezhania sediminis TaxID=2599291 RepID=UPI00389964C4